MPEPITKRSIPVPPSLQLFTITETAVILGVSRRLVSNWIQEGALAGHPPRPRPATGARQRG